jgi:hypothetical protein
MIKRLLIGGARATILARSPRFAPSASMSTIHSEFFPSSTLSCLCVRNMGRRALSQTIEARRSRDRLRHQRSRALQKAKILLCDRHHQHIAIGADSNASQISPATNSFLPQLRLIHLESLHRLSTAQVWFSMKRATSRLLPCCWRHTARPKSPPNHVIDQSATG